MAENYYEKVFLDNFRTEEEKELEQADTATFAGWIGANPEKFAPVFKWFLNFYFNGLDENSQVVCFDDDIKRCAKEGVTKLLLIDATAKGQIVNYSLLGIMALAFHQPYEFDDIEKKHVIELLEDIRKKSEHFTWKTLDWDYFFSQCWIQVVSEIFEEEASSFERLKNSFIVKLINDYVSPDLTCEWIDKDDNYQPPHSGMGFDFSKFFPKYNTLKSSECIHPATQGDADLAKQS